MHSKTSKLRDQLANAAQEREQIEKQKKELEIQMNKGKNNMDKISKGLKGHEISNSLAELDIDEVEHVKHSRTKSITTGKISRNASTKSELDRTHPSPVKTSSIYNIKTNPSSSSIDVNATMPRLLAIKQTVIIPSNTRISDWCYTGSIISSPPTVKSNDVYEFVRWLGRGSFGDVQLVKSMEEKQLYAMKTIFSEHEDEMKKTLREVVFLRTYRHPYIIDILDSFLTQQPKMLYIVMHYCEGGDLGKLITTASKNSTSLSEHQIVKWSIQLALALHFLHENQIIHRDLKPSNALLTDGGETVKLADFGLTFQLENNICERATEAGTPLYAAPEMINGEKYSYPIDCWSFGVMLHELMSLSPPFYKSDTTELVKSILNDEPPDLPVNYSTELKLICSLFLNKNPAHRLGFAAMLCDPFISSKVQTFSSSYRPRSLEERIRRAHVKQLQAQIESLSSSQLSSSIDVVELIRLTDIERAEKASIIVIPDHHISSSSNIDNEMSDDDINNINATGTRLRGNSMHMIKKPSFRKQSLNDSPAKPASSSSSSIIPSRSNSIKEEIDDTSSSIMPSSSMMMHDTLTRVDSFDDKEVDSEEEEDDDDDDQFIIPNTISNPVPDDNNDIIHDPLIISSSSTPSPNDVNNDDDKHDEVKDGDVNDDDVVVVEDTSNSIISSDESSSSYHVNGGRIGQAIAEALEIDKQLSEAIE